MNIPKGFIKESDGNYRRGKFIFKEGHIVRESTLLPNEESKDDVLSNTSDTIEEAIRLALSYNSDMGNPTRKDNLFITKSGDAYKIDDKESSNTVAIITTDNNVYRLDFTDITNQDDTNKLKSDDKDNAKSPSEVKDLNTKPVELKESTELVYTKEVRTKDGKESMMFTDETSDYSAIKQFIKDYVTGYTEDDVEVIHYDTPVTTTINLDDQIEEADEETSEENAESEPSTEENNLKPLSSTYFIRRPNNIDELKDKINKHLVTPATYSVVDEVSLNQEEFDDYANNLRQDKDFLKSFRPTPTDADFTCIAVKAPDGTTLLIDNSGYDSAQYVGLID